MNGHHPLTLLLLIASALICLGFAILTFRLQFASHKIDMGIALMDLFIAGFFIWAGFGWSAPFWIAAAIVNLACAVKHSPRRSIEVGS